MSKETAVSFAERGCTTVRLLNDIPFGHKFALSDLSEGETIVKYGVPIGQLIRPVKAGEHIHLHNLVTLQRRGDVQ
ncbi:hypothetical protein GC093_15110 [Paenibacillus sp. LMG 31456]|uniref:SAF domain-containing protein n=2 Tax=Paenibacillus foliorum TaxID=2654974 RepID=A0A972K342_9BACL|nr:hypothetical protein [Paenibacillus foliorum]